VGVLELSEELIPEVHPCGDCEECRLQLEEGAKEVRPAPIHPGQFNREGEQDRSRRRGFRQAPLMELRLQYRRPQVQHPSLQ
jgi:hypothetical protein